MSTNDVDICFLTLPIWSMTQGVFEKLNFDVFKKTMKNFVEIFYKTSKLTFVKCYFLRKTLGFAMPSNGTTQVRFYSDNTPSNVVTCLNLIFTILILVNQKWFTRSNSKLSYHISLFLLTICKFFNQTMTHC